MAKKIIAANADLKSELQVLSKEIRRRDGKGTMRILPAGNAIGQHGKTALFVGFDEIHGYRDWDLLEALQPDPSRPDAITWITSYDSIWDSPGCPLHDLKEMGKRGDDPRMLFSWYSADFCTDPAFANLPADERANPSMASWPEGAAYIEQQRRRLPSNRFRRLHHNLPGAPGGAFFDQGLVDAAIVRGRTALPPQAGIDYGGFVDMSGGSQDDAVLAIAHLDGKKVVLDLLISQAGGVPFNPRLAVTRFADALQRYRCRRVKGDSYAGETFRQDFAQHSIEYTTSDRTTSQLYEEFEVVLNAGAVELLDIAKMQQQLVTLVIRGAKIDHLPGAHDDWACATAGVIVLLTAPSDAAGWIAHYKTLAERAQQASAPQDDDEQTEQFYLPGNPHAAQPPPAPNNDPRAKHPWQPESLCGNAYSDSYFGAMSKAEGRMVSLQTPKCLCCGNQTNSRITDGVHSWCHDGCRQQWVRGIAERNKNRELAENNGLPLKSEPVKRPNATEAA